MKYTRPKVWVRLFRLKIRKNRGKEGQEGTEELTKYIVVRFFILKYDFTTGNEHIISI